MAKVDITHKCGHVVEHNLMGPYKDRDRRAQWLADGDCPTCDTKRREEANRAANAAAAQDAGLPELLGSEKQIAWAESIRVKAIADAEAAIAATATTAERKAQVAPLLARLKAQDKAAWWIDNRSATGVQLLKNMAGVRK